MQHKKSALPDTELLELMKYNDRGALAAVYDRYAWLLYREIFRRVRVKSVSEKIIADIFVTLWTERKTLVIQTTFQYYLQQAAKYQLLLYFGSQPAAKDYAADFNDFILRHSHDPDNNMPSFEDSHTVMPVNHIALRIARFLKDSIQDLFQACSKAYYFLQRTFICVFSQCFNVIKNIPSWLKRCCSWINVFGKRKQ